MRMTRKNFLKKWDELAEGQGITSEKYTPARRILKKEEDELMMCINYSPLKASRPGSKGTGSCPLDDKVEKGFLEFGRGYYPYALSINNYPAGRGHSLIIHKDHEGKDYRPDMEDIKNFRRISRDLGCNVTTNLKGSGATVPCHKHAHVMFQATPMQMLRKKSTHACRIKEAEGYPYVHAIFTGPDSPDMAWKGLLSKYTGTYGMLISKDDIYVVPFRRNWDRGFSINEACGLFFAENDVLDKGYDYFMGIMDTTLIRKEGEQSLKEFLDVPDAYVEARIYKEQ